MLINFFALLIAFFDGSNQTDKLSFRRVDLHESGPYNLSENNFKFSFWSDPPIPVEVGRMKILQFRPIDQKEGDDYDVTYQEKVTGNCTDEWKQE